MTIGVPSLESFAGAFAPAPQVPKTTLRPGDVLLVATQNSLYEIHVTANASVTVRGGIFDRRGQSPVTLRIAGCSLGGSMIRTDIAAACGFCLEFSNRIITSPITRFTLFPFHLLN